jgi:hypothetical protein
MLCILTCTLVELLSLVGHWISGHKTLVVFFISSGNIALTPAPSSSFAVRHSSLHVSCYVSRLYESFERDDVSLYDLQIKQIRMSLVPWMASLLNRNPCQAEFIKPPFPLCRLLSRWVRDFNIFINLDSLCLAFSSGHIFELPTNEKITQWPVL